MIVEDPGLSFSKENVLDTDARAIEPDAVLSQSFGGTGESSCLF